MTDNACLLKVRKSLSRWRTGASLTRVAGWRGEGGTGNMVTTPTQTNWQLPLWRSGCCLCPVISPVAASVDSFLTAHYISCQWRRAVVMNESENGISKCWFDHIKRHRGGGEWCREVTHKMKTNQRQSQLTNHFRAKGGYVILIISALATLFFIWVVVLLYVCYQKKWHTRWFSLLLARQHMYIYCMIF